MNTLLAAAIYAITTAKTMTVDYVLGASSVRAERTMSLANRNPDPRVSGVFKDNILLTLNYMDGAISDPTKIDWSAVTKPKTYMLTLNPGEIFSFHEKVLPQFGDKVTKTMRAHFNWTDGFKSDGYLTGDGVCHLASIMYWAARDAGLTTLAPTNHDFANIPEVPKEYGVSIYYDPQSSARSISQNLYITNTFDKPIQFAFAYDGDNLTVRVID